MRMYWGKKILEWSPTPEEGFATTLAFYRKMRRRYDILMDGEKPAGGDWNFDTESGDSSFVLDVRGSNA